MAYSLVVTVHRLGHMGGGLDLPILAGAGRPAENGGLDRQKQLVGH